MFIKFIAVETVLIVTSAIICDTGQIYMSVLLSPQEKRRRPNEYL
jgi:hypothetical protein